MSNIEMWMLGIHGVICVGVLIGIVVLGIRAYRIKKSEEFEDRDN